MVAVIQLAEELGVRFAFPTSTIQIEEMPGQVGLQPTYATAPQKLDQKLQQFLADYKERMRKKSQDEENDKMQSGESGESN